jgi:hypothetical protein
MLHLNDTDRSLLAGERGPGSQMAMRIIVRMAEVYAASELLDTTTTHIDNTIFMGDATLEYAERLADLGATVAVPVTSNVSGVDEHGWGEWPMAPDWATKNGGSRTSEPTLCPPAPQQTASLQPGDRLLLRTKEIISQRHRTVIERPRLI